MKKTFGLILSILTTAIVMAILQYYFVGISERFVSSLGGLLSIFFICIIIVIFMIAIPFLIIFKLLLKAHKIRIIYQCIVIGIVSALLMLVLQLLVPFRQSTDYLRILIVLIPGCLFPFIAHFLIQNCCLKRINNKYNKRLKEYSHIP